MLKKNLFDPDEDQTCLLTGYKFHILRLFPLFELIQFLPQNKREAHLGSHILFFFWCGSSTAGVWGSPLKVLQNGTSFSSLSCRMKSPS